MSNTVIERMWYIVLDIIADVDNKVGKNKKKEKKKRKKRVFKGPLG